MCVLESNIDKHLHLVREIHARRGGGEADWRELVGVGGEWKFLIVYIGGTPLWGVTMAALKTPPPGTIVLSVQRLSQAIVVLLPRAVLSVASPVVLGRRN